MNLIKEKLIVFLLIIKTKRVNEHYQLLKMQTALFGIIFFSY